MLSVCKKLTPGSRMKYKDEPYLQFFFYLGFLSRTWDSQVSRGREKLFF